MVWIIRSGALRLDKNGSECPHLVLCLTVRRHASLKRVMPYTLAVKCAIPNFFDYLAESGEPSKKMDKEELGE